MERGGRSGGGRRLTPARDTLFALSSGQGRAGVAVIRLSGPAAGTALSALAGALPPARRASLRRLRDPRDGAFLDQALVLWLPAPGSFTGEDMAELQVHGGRAVVAAVLGALARQPGLRPAEPGAFTRRAFDNGRLDLTSVEGLADLIDADSEAQRRLALRQAEGELGRAAAGWAAALADILARVEAAIDFSDEELPEGLIAEARQATAALAADLRRVLEAPPVAERLRDGFRVAILGAPNAGKSSLLNVLAGRDAAIVSDRAGTTRDVVEVALELDGYPLLLADTAGLRDAEREALDPVETEGIRRSLARAADADLRLLLFDGTACLPDEATLSLAGKGALVVLTKADIPAAAEALAPVQDVLRVSTLTGVGISALLESLARRAAAHFAGDEAEAPPLARARQRAAVQDCLKSLERAVEAQQPELLAEDLRLALRCLGRLVGRVDVEDLLDRIFRDFCIGK